MRKESVPRLQLFFPTGELNLYGCAITLLTGNLNELYDWSTDVLSKDWNPQSAYKKLLSQPSFLACDALMDQNIFAVVGNIIKNKVLFCIRLHPESIMSKVKFLIAPYYN